MWLERRAESQGARAGHDGGERGPRGSPGLRDFHWEGREWGRWAWGMRGREPRTQAAGLKVLGEPEVGSEIVRAVRKDK